jgi:hypothetical protein
VHIGLFTLWLPSDTSQDAFTNQGGLEMSKLPATKTSAAPPKSPTPKSAAPKRIVDTTTPDFVRRQIEISAALQKLVNEINELEPQTPLSGPNWSTMFWQLQLAEDSRDRAVRHLNNQNLSGAQCQVEQGLGAAASLRNFLDTKTKKPAVE